MATVTITELTQNVTVEETTQAVTVSGATNFPITIEYNATVVSGDQGPAGQGVPTGGTAGQLLAKINSTNYATEWIDPPQGFSGNYNDLTNKPTLATVATSGSYNDLLNKPVLFSGSYNDLTNKPTIPDSTSDLTNDSGFITSADVTWNNVSGKPTFATVATSGSYTDLTNTPAIPDATSDLTNDSGFITSSALTGRLTDIVQDTTPQLGGDLDLNNKSIYGGTIANGNNIQITTDGIFLNGGTGFSVTGNNVNVNSSGPLSLTSTDKFNSNNALIQLGTFGLNVFHNIATKNIQPVQSTGGVRLTSGSGLVHSEVTNSGVNVSGPLTVTTTGNVTLASPNVRIGQSGSAATLTSNGAASLTLNTNSGTNSGNITINPGVNANIAISTNGTGVISTRGHIIPNANITYDLGSATNRFRTLYLSGNTIDLGGTTISADQSGLVIETNQQLQAIASTDYVDEAFSTAITTVSESQPTSAVIGEQWFNPTSQILSVYTATGWVQVSADDLQF